MFSMKKNISSLCLIMITCPCHAQSLDVCQQAAEKNYPLIKQYDLINQTTQLTVDNIQKGWLPQVNVSVQATYQSAVASWPKNLQQAYQQMGLNMKGLSKDQYKISVELQQTIYDGGAISNQRRIIEQEGKVQKAQTESNLYQVRRRVNEMYFSLLLLDEQIRLNDDVRTLLESSEKKLSAMVKGGIAATSDYDNVKAERLGAEQQGVSLKQQRQMLLRLLSTFCGIEISNIHKPVPITNSTSANNRPELRLYDQQLKLTEAREKALDAQLRPKLGLFAQGYYGYPGLNMFEDMMSRKWSLNGIVGIKLSWNVGTLYTRKNDKNLLSMQRNQIENAREVFLFNNKLDEMQQLENINRFQTMMNSDAEIISLRTNVRKAAESKLAHGIIDVNSLLREINNENAAKTQQTIHEIDMLKEMYNLKYTYNK